MVKESQISHIDIMNAVFKEVLDDQIEFIDKGKGKARLFQQILRLRKTEFQSYGEGNDREFFRFIACFSLKALKKAVPYISALDHLCFSKSLFLHPPEYGIQPALWRFPL